MRLAYSYHRRYQGSGPTVVVIAYVGLAQLYPVHKTATAAVI